MSDDQDHGSIANAETTSVELVPELPVKLQRKHPRLSATWSAARPLVKFSLYGAAFAGGALLLARLLGPRTARSLGREGGEGFAEGVNKAQTEIAAATRGMRWG